MKWLKLLLLSLFIGLLSTGVLNPLLVHLSDKNWLTRYLLDHGTVGHVSILLAACAFVGLGGPRQAMAFMFGYLYGPYLGTVTTLMVCGLAALANYMVARMVLAHTLAHYFPQRMEQFNRFASRVPFMKILILRLFPVGSNLVTNLLSGSVAVPILAFISASLLGYLPQTLVFSLLGAGIQGADHSLLYLSIGLGVLSIGLTGLIYRDHLKQKVAILHLENNT